MEIKRICNKCGKQSKQAPSKNKICEYCKKGRIKTYLQCKICLRWFHPKQLKAITCSRECKNKLHSMNGTSKKGKTYPKCKRARVATCPICLKEFRAIKDQNGKFGGKIRKQIYCSKECWSQRKPPTAKKCRYCGIIYMSYETEKKQYCTKQCRDLDYRERFKGENSHLWKGGRTKESKVRRTRKAYREWREKVFKRDQYTCQKCKLNKQHIQAHHIKPIKDYLEKIYDVDNGQTLCVNCHQKEHPELKLNLQKSVNR